MNFPSLPNAGFYNPSSFNTNSTYVSPSGAFNAGEQITKRNQDYQAGGTNAVASHIADDQSKDSAKVTGSLSEKYTKKMEEYNKAMANKISYESATAPLIWFDSAKILPEANKFREGRAANQRHVESLEQELAVLRDQLGAEMESYKATKRLMPKAIEANIQPMQGLPSSNGYGNTVGASGGSNIRF